MSPIRVALLALALGVLGVGCGGDDINEGAFVPAPGNGVLEEEPNGQPNLAQLLEPVPGEPLVVEGSFSQVGLLSGELDFYRVRIPDGAGGTLTGTVDWEDDLSDYEMAFYGGAGVANFDGFGPDKPSSFVQEVDGGTTYDLLAFAATGSAGDYLLTLDLR